MSDGLPKKVTDGEMWDAMRVVYRYVNMVPRGLLPKKIGRALDMMELGFEHYMVVVPHKGSA